MMSMTPKELIERCERIAGLSSRMLDAARAGDWAEVGRLRQCASAAIDDVRESGAATRLSAEERRQKFSHLERIVANAGQIQALAEPEIGSLHRWWPSSGLLASGAGDPYCDVPK